MNRLFLQVHSDVFGDSLDGNPTDGVHDRAVNERRAGSEYRHREDPRLRSSCARIGGVPRLNYALVTAWLHKI
jgi:hypothetical protein